MMQELQLDVSIAIGVISFSPPSCSSLALMMTDFSLSLKNPYSNIQNDSRFNEIAYMLEVATNVPDPDESDAMPQLDNSNPPDADKDLTEGESTSP